MPIGVVATPSLGSIVARLPYRLCLALLLSCGALACAIVVECAVLFPKELRSGLSPDFMVARRLSFFNDDLSALAMVTTYSRMVRYESFRVTVRRYDLQTGASRIELPEHPGAVWRDLATTAGGQAILCAEDGSLYRLDLSDSAAVPIALEKAAGECINFLTCSDDGGLAIAAGKWLSAWCVASGKIIWQRRDQRIDCCAFVPGTRRPICTLDTGEVVELDPATGQTTRLLSSRGPACVRIAISPDGQRLAAVNAAGCCMVVDLPAARRLWSRPLGHSPTCPQFSQDGASLLVANAGREFATLVVSAATGIDERAIPSLAGISLGLRVTGDGTLYQWDSDGTISAWDLATGKIKRRIES